jgi:sterol desaturase/sphingolipid hydroxylase (fatty acid hydroxylase superfamily)
MEAYTNALKIGILFFVVLIFIELAVSFLMKKRVYRVMDTISGLSSGMTNNVKSILKLTVIVVSYSWMVEHFAIFELTPSVWLYVSAFLLIDFAAYWSHRWNHEINLFWNRHVAHHSSEEFNLAAALRQPLSDIVAVYFFLYVPMAIVGIPEQVILTIAPIHLFAQFWYHTRLINRMGFLEKIIVTPSHHRVHHAINAEYIDKNYAAIFIFWDKWFGTFQEEKADIPPVYGVKKAVETWNPIVINFLHFWQLAKDAWRTEKLWDKCRIWLMPTGWRPKDVNEKYPITYTENAYDQIKFDTPTTPFLNGWSIFQLAIHLAFQFHILELLPDLPYQITLFYGLFLILSIFAYTTLMDRHWLAVPVEFVKMLVGFGLIYYHGSWFFIDDILPFGTVMIGVYFLVSFGVTIWFGREKSSPSLSRELVD